jgi:hypothetical protein
MDPEVPEQAQAAIADKAQFLVLAQAMVTHSLQSKKPCQKIQTSYLMTQTVNRKPNMTTSCIETITAHRPSHQSTKQVRRRDGHLGCLATAAKAQSRAGPHPKQVEAAEASTGTSPTASTQASLPKSAKSHKCWQVGEKLPIQAPEGVETYSRSSTSSSKSTSRISKSATKPRPSQISPT